MPTPERRHEGIASELGEWLLEHLRTHEVTKATTFIRHTDENERWAAAHGWSRALSGPLIAVDPRNVPAPRAAGG